MSQLARFGVSLDEELLQGFDRLIHERGYRNRSEALRDLIRDELVRGQWHTSDVVAGTITMVYDHHTRGLATRLNDIQHECLDAVVSTQHIHLDHHNCLEVIVVKGNPSVIQQLAYQLKAVRGVKHSALTMATTGRGLV